MTNITPEPSKANPSLSEQAWAYHSWGWSIVPLGVQKKTATVKWKTLQIDRPSDEFVRRNWPPASKRNIGIICGPVSANLLVRDFDNANDYAAWAKSVPELARQLPTVATRRGFHVYFRDSEAFTRSVDLRSEFGIEGEIKGYGAYVVAAGSTVSFNNDTEVDPFTYHWIVLPEIAGSAPVIPTICMRESGLAPDTIHSTTNTASVTNHSQQDQTHPGKCSARQFDTDELPLLDIVDRRPISGPAQRNTALWHLAMDLRSYCQRIPTDDVIQYVLTAWLERNSQHCRTQEWLVNWSEFRSMVHRVNGDSTFLTRMPATYTFTPVPQWSHELRGGEKLDRIARVIVAADELAKHQPFFLSLRDIARIAGDMTAMTARAGVKHLRDLGILQLITAGEPRPGGKANVYQLLVDEDGSVRR